MHQTVKLEEFQLIICFQNFFTLLFTVEQFIITILYNSSLPDRPFFIIFDLRPRSISLH